MQTPITLFEHAHTLYNWSDAELTALEGLNRANHAEILLATIHNGQKVVRASEFVGMIQLRRNFIQVLPKIYAADITDPASQALHATRNLLYLLSVAGKFPIKEQQIASLISKNQNWIEILTHLFATHLLQEWQRGASRNYRLQDDDLPVLKGKWRFNDQLRHPERIQTFPVSYDEFTDDINLNRLLRFVVELLWTITRDNNNRRLLGILRQWMGEVSLVNKFTVTEAERIQLNRLNHRYEPLLNMARIFLQGLAYVSSVGKQQAYSFVFDMNALYETFIINFIRKNRNVLPARFLDCEFLPQTRGATLHLARQNERSVFLLKPDLAFKRGDEYPLLLDLKYKRLKTELTSRGVSPADIYQMYAYAQRYKCPEVLLLYPLTIDMQEPIHARFEVISGNGTIRVETVDLRIDLNSNPGRQNLINQLNKILEG